MQRPLGDPQAQTREDPSCSLMKMLCGRLAQTGASLPDNGVSINCDIAFAIAVAELLQLPDDLPLMPAVKAAMSVPTRLSDRASLANLRAVARAAGRAALADADKRPFT
jgi:hypothetical protein